MGFIHTGHERSFVYDIADLYKAEITIPIAFEVAAKQSEDIGGVVRRRVRDEISDGHILERAVKDIHRLLLSDSVLGEEIETDVLNLWDDKEGLVPNAVSYGKELDKIDEEALADGYRTLIEDET